MSLDDAGSEALSWYDVLVLVRFLQEDSSAAISKELHGPRWDMATQLLAVIADALHMANWQRAGKKSAPRPKRLPRPWEKPKSTSLGSKPIPISQFNDWWDNAAPKPKRSRRRTRKTPATTK